MTKKHMPGCLLAIAVVVGPIDGIAQQASSSPGGASGYELSGGSWRLVKIESMDDRIDKPADHTLYTLSFEADGVARIRADCNRGTASWISESAGRLRFGPIAATRAMCLPGSLSERFLDQFQWVRSYVMEDGHLFLATMADGSIIEFEPMVTAPLAATVLGEEIRTTDADEMQRAVLTRLFDQYAAEHGIHALESEIGSYVENLQRALRADGLAPVEDLTPQEAEEVAALRNDMARSVIRQWKLNRELYSQYGGRVIFQQLGPEPVDAYRMFLEERLRAGAFKIHNPEFEAAFWRYFTDDSIHSFFEPGSEAEASAFSVPPWEE